MNSVYISNSEKETEEFAFVFSKDLRGGEIIAFIGDLGMGKTCFTRGLCRGLDYKGDVYSPTFAIVNEYRGGRLPVFHFDMYRVGSWEDLYSTGFFDYIEYGGISVVEWSENIASALENENVIFVKFEHLGDNSRRITVSKDDGLENTIN